MVYNRFDNPILSKVSDQSGNHLYLEDAPVL